MSSLITSLRSLLGPPDPRSEPQIQRDLDDEFAFHLAMLEDELIESGVPREVAAAMANARFGNIDRVRNQCQRIALEDRLMMQKINFVLMVTVMLAVIGVSIQVAVTQRYNTLALQDITSQIAKMRIDARLEAREWAGVSDSFEAQQPHVMIEGHVERPGWYPIETDPPTLLHEVVRQTSPTAEAATVVYRRNGETRATRYSLDDLTDESPVRILVTSGDIIRIEPQSRSELLEQWTHRSRVASKPDKTMLAGVWREADAAGNVLPEGGSISIIGNDDIRNLRGYPHGILSLPQHEVEFDLSFVNVPPGGPELRILDQNVARDWEWHNRTLPDDADRGRWTFEDDGGVLLLNISSAAPTITEPLRFKRVDGADGSAVADSRPGD